MTYDRTTIARSTGLPVTTASAETLGLDPCDGACAWYNSCDTHAAIIGHRTLRLARYFAPAPEEWCEECRELAAWRRIAPGATTVPVLVAGVDYEQATCDNCGLVEHTPDELAACVDSMVAPPLCPHCEERHADLSGGDPDGDPGCDWDRLSGNSTRTPDWHPADDPRHLTSDRIGFSVSS